ncbi:ATP-binding protein [Nocardioides sp. CFH 31398]|uniref:ATP-binding protein n=1 Tax=Nocardioides sp. CFH 31398 TaxID=2919579 RepID=UPI001F06B8A7|nr:ATP-binding protein [Nocardioides sp. CFH 31398]MCH1865460.1 ATP-binding protein [Nocardioides sp. CFH 31398]
MEVQVDVERAVGPAPPRVPVVPAWSFWCFLVAYVVLVLAGRATALVEGGPALVWPAAGAGVLWLLARPGRRWAASVLGAVAVVALTLHAVTGAAPGLVLAGTLAAVLQPVVAVLVLRRWCPRLLGAGGDRTISDPSLLARTVLAAGLASAVGALAATTSMLLFGEPATVLTTVLWWTRNLSGMLLALTAGHLLLHAVVTGTRVLPSRRRVPELCLLLLTSLGAFALAEVDRGQGMACLLIGTSVWCALRFSTALAALEVAGVGALGVALVVVGRAGYPELPDASDAVMIQAFTVTLLTVALAIGSSRDQRDAVLAELDEARRDAAGRARHLETVTEVMGEGLTVLDADANLVRMNSAARAILEMTPAGATAPTAARDYVVCAPDGSVLDPRQHPSVRAITEGRVGPEDLLLVLDDGSRRTLSVTADMLSDGGRSVGSVVVFHDVTDERRQTDQLAEFAATAAHDLRNPLTALRGWLEMATETATDGPSQLSLSRAREAAARMQALITDLLEQASAEGGLLSAGELEAVPLDLAVDDVARYLPTDAVLTREAELPVVSAHPEMLRQLLTNLLGNAVKYVEPGVTPRIAVTARRVGDRVEVEVEDNGIGIPESERTRVFERLHRAHADDGRFGGTGLGLAICRTVVLRHGGHIECRPAAGGGTVLAFDLPAAVPDVPPVAAPRVDGALTDEG